MDAKIRKALEEKLDELLAVLAYNSKGLEDNERADIKLITDALAMAQLGEIASYVEDVKIVLSQWAENS